MGYSRKAPHPSHGLLESYIHRSIALFAYLTMIYSVFMMSAEVLKHSKTMNIPFAEGNPWIHRVKDPQDMDWYLIEDAFFKTMWRWFLGHVIINHVLIKIGCLKARKYIFPVLTFAFLMTILGPKVTALVLVHSAMLSFVACVTGSHVCVWVVSVTCIASLSVQKLRFFMESYFPFSVSIYEEHYIRENLLAMNMLRSTSVALFILESRGSRSNEEITDRSSKNSENENETSHSRQQTALWKLWADIICYILYFPLAPFGPFMSLKEFLRQLNRQPTADDYDISAKGEKKLMKFGLWILIYEVSLHYLFIDTILFSGKFLFTTNLWAMIGAAYLHGQMFMVRHFIKWNLTSGIAHLDFMDTVPPPACFYLIYRYTDMWRWFDIGFYEFTKDYIYVPMGGSRFGWRRQVLAMLSVFVFVFIWHGCRDFTAIWVSINAMALMLETFARLFTLYLASFQRFKLSPTCLRRIHTLIHIPIYLMTNVGSFLFVGGPEYTSTIVQRLAFEGFPTSIICSVVATYCIIQTSKDYENYIHNISFRRENVDK